MLPCDTHIMNWVLQYYGKARKHRF